MKPLATIPLPLVLFASLSAQEPAFRAGVETVRVDVRVSDGRVPATGLQASDFQVLDNGVPQEVDLMSFDHLPLNVVLALDMSSSVTGERLDHLRAAGRAVAGALTGDDKVALVAFANAVEIRTALTNDLARVTAAIDTPASPGNTALVDASYAAMTLGESDAGRALVIVFSDGADTMSFLNPDAVVASAKRSDAVVYAVTVGNAGGTNFLRDLSSTTGGRVLTLKSTDALRDTLVGILDEFRHRYVISYSPKGVPKDGWHKLDVKTRNPKLTVSARPGYQR